jgi:hypothetical protein
LKKPPLDPAKTFHTRSTIVPRFSTYYPIGIIYTAFPKKGLEFVIFMSYSLLRVLCVLCG